MDATERSACAPSGSGETWSSVEWKGDGSSGVPAAGAYREGGKREAIQQGESLTVDTGALVRGQAVVGEAGDE